MEGNVFQTFVYYWPLYAASDHVLHDDVMNDRARWRKMEHDWYVSGKPYRALESFDGEPNPFFDRWLQHPDYDAYWQNMIPYRDDFARIDIPVLTTTGYYDDGQIGALYYLSEHYKYRPNAEHYLLIGPYDHVRGQRGTVSLLGDHQKVLEGYTLDDAAQIDLGDLRYKWFDYVFRGAARPVILQDRINFETMGSNKWRHAGSLGGMAEGREAFHLSGEKRGEFYRLARSGEALTAAGASLTVNLADRSDADRVSPTSGDLIDKNFDNWNSVTFVSDPFERPAEISGLFSGSLDFVTNKKDFDVEIDLYELDAKGNYLQLAYYKGRASHIKDRSVRQLLVPEEPTRLDFTSGRLMSRRFEPGSRLVVQIGVMKSPFAQVNFGSGKDVSDESVADAGEPLRIDWLPATTIEIPMRDTAR
jgi:putative CocE/NonD family hydrolase